MPGSLALTTLSQRLVTIVAALRAKVAASSGRDRAMIPLLTLAWLRLGRLASRFEVLLARIAAGTPVVPRRPRIRVAGVVDRPAPVADRPEGVLRLPTRHGWLVRMTQETAQLRGHVEGLLADPEMVALLAAAPGAGRILRPLCHMLMIDPGPALALPRAAKPRSRKSVARVSVPRKRAVKRAPVEPPCDEASAISQVWAALRRQGFVETRDPIMREPPWPGMNWSS